MIKNGWLYAFFVFLAQTCNPYYSATEKYDDNVIEIPPDVIEPEEGSLAAPPPPPPPPPEEMIFKVVEEMPRFPGCENQGLSKQELKKCSTDKMLEFIATNLKYPKIAKDNGVEGRVIIQFVVDKSGAVTQPKILRDPGAECGQEALRIVKKMPKWIAGKQRGQSVKVQYTLPVSFKL